MITKIIQNEPYYLEIIITDINGNGVPGLTINYTVHKSATGTLIESGVMNDIGNGIYQKQITLSDLGQYRVFYLTPFRYENSIETIMVVEEITDDLSSIHSKLNRILGLSQENYKLYDTVYNSGNMTAGKIKIYPSKADLEADTNVIATYQITATYDSSNNVSQYKVVRLP